MNWITISWMAEKQPVKIYEVVIFIGETRISWICADVRHDEDGFLICDPCPELTPEIAEKWRINAEAKLIKTETWINTRQVHSVEELGEINE